MTGREELYTNLQKPQIPALDGVRMIAVFLVIFYHFGFAAVPGARGVMMFFVLSGFLITWLLLKEHEKTGTISLKGFYRRRTLRIFPAFYAFWLGIVALRLATSTAVPWGQAWSSFFYVSNYYSALNHHPENIFSHTWSLAVEEQFYLLWPVLFLACRQNLRLMTSLLIGIMVCGTIHRTLLAYVFGVDQSYVYSAFDTRIDQLLTGCLLAVVLKRRALPRFWQAACGHQVAPLVTILAFIVLMVAGRAFVPRYRDVLGFTLEPLLIAVFLAQVVALSKTRAWSWLNIAPVRFLGRISYSLYLYQQLTLYPVKRVLQDYPTAVQLLVALAVTIIVASLSYYVIERPFLQWKHRPSVPRAIPEPALV